MGSCVSKITITDELFLQLKSSPNDKLLLSLSLHYDIYDKQSQQKIDELLQISLSTDKGISVFTGTDTAAELPCKEKIEIKKDNISIE